MAARLAALRRAFVPHAHSFRLSAAYQSPSLFPTPAQLHPPRPPPPPAFSNPQGCAIWSAVIAPSTPSMLCRFQVSLASQHSVIVPKRLLSSSTSQADDSKSEGFEEHKDYRSLSFRDFMSSVGTAPLVPMVLGIAGAIPFLVLTPPFPYWLALPEVLSANPIEAQTLYAAVILSFLGGPHWGLAMVGIRASPNHRIFNFAINTLRYIWSVIPCLIAWPALLLSTIPKLQLLIFAFGLALGVDIFFAGHGLTPPWYLPLRMLLSGIVILCLMTSLIEVFLVDKLKHGKESAEQNS